MVDNISVQEPAILNNFPSVLDLFAMNPSVNSSVLPFDLQNYEASKHVYAPVIAPITSTFASCVQFNVCGVISHEMGETPDVYAQFFGLLRQRCKGKFQSR